MTPWDVIAWAFAVLVVAIVGCFVISAVWMIVEEARRK